MATLTDEEMAALEAKEAKRPAMTDEEMADYEALQGRPDPAVMKSRRERVVDYLKSRPAAIADTAKSLVTPGGGVDQAFAGRYLMGLPATVEAAADTAPAALRALAGGPSVGDEWRRNLAKRRAPYEAAEAKEPGAALVGSMLAPNLAGKATAGQRVLSSGTPSFGPTKPNGPSISRCICATAISFCCLCSSVPVPSPTFTVKSVRSRHSCGLTVTYFPFMRTMRCLSW